MVPFPTHLNWYDEYFSICWAYIYQSIANIHVEISMFHSKREIHNFHDALVYVWKMDPKCQDCIT